MEENAKQNLCQESRFQRFYTDHIQGVQNFAFYKCGDEAASRDLVQEAFLKIWQNCSKIDIDKAKSYLFTSVNNLFLNTVKHSKVVLSYEKNYTGPDKTHMDPEFLIEEKEFKTKLQNAISNLTEGQREVFLLNRIDGKKYREIADLLSISVKAVEKRMSLALKSLRDEIPNI